MLRFWPLQKRDYRWQYDFYEAACPIKGHCFGKMRAVVYQK